MIAKKMLLVALGAGTMLTASAASAQTVYTSRAAFLAAVSGATTTTFNDVTTDIAVGAGNTVQGYTFTGVTEDQSLIDAPPFTNNPVAGVDGTTYFSLAGLANGATYTIGLGGAFNAFGFDTHNYDINNDRSEVFIGLQSLGLTPAARGGVGFLGFVAAPGASFSTVSIVSRGFSAYNGFDNFTTANRAGGAVPEPASWAMLLFGFGAIGGVLRRRRATVSFA